MRVPPRKEPFIIRNDGEVIRATARIPVTTGVVKARAETKVNGWCSRIATASLGLALLTELLKGENNTGLVYTTLTALIALSGADKILNYKVVRYRIEKGV